MDLFGAAALTAFAGLLAFNQVVIKVTGDGLNPLFQAGVRSVLGFGVLWLWGAYHYGKLGPYPAQVRFWGVIAGILFAVEFLCLYVALDIGSVSRVSILFYSMPVWLALVAHFFLPGERLNLIRGLGLILAMGGVVIAFADRTSAHASLLADVLALAAAFGWGAIALLLRLTPLSTVPPVAQLRYQLLISAPLLLLLSPIFGPAIRDFEPIHIASLLFQSICIASLGFMAWFHLIKIYRASSVASFSFLSPVLAVLLGWVLLNEDIGPQIWISLTLVAVGVVLINRQ
jgi:drug/metabolite transporter (DMT)-like permease